jgi:histidinol-phosphate phosphatase family protein
MGNNTPYNTLFLDRDGVINVQRPGDYVKSIDEFEFIDGVLEALRLLSPLFRHVVVVTNQRGIGRGILTMQEVEAVHSHLLAHVEANGGRIDRIYISSTTDSSHPDRKPNIGMALRAQHDFPDMDFSGSWMVGDSLSDMLFAENAGIPAVWVGEKQTPEEMAVLKIHAHYPDLITFAKALVST